MTLAVISTDTIEHCYSIDYNKLVDKPGLLCHLNPFLHTQSFLIKCLCSPWVHTHPLTVVLVPNIVDMTCYCEGCAIVKGAWVLWTLDLWPCSCNAYLRCLGVLFVSGHSSKARIDDLRAAKRIPDDSVLRLCPQSRFIKENAGF